MNNRAKCKLCGSIIESFIAGDYVECKCGEIALDDGQAMRCFAKNFTNFLRVDDHGNEIVIQFKGEHVSPTVDQDNELVKKNAADNIDYHPPTKKEKLDMLRTMITNIEKLPPGGMSTFVNHYDLWSALALVLSILDDDSCN